jgi:hypothetical protein
MVTYPPPQTPAKHQPKISAELPIDPEKEKHFILLKFWLNQIAA